MNAIKNLIVLAALAVVCYGVYHSMTAGPATDAPPEVAPNWGNAPQAELGSADVGGAPLGVDAQTGRQVDPAGLPNGFAVDAAAGAPDNRLASQAWPGSEQTAVELPAATPDSTQGTIDPANPYGVPEEDTAGAANSGSLDPWNGQATDNAPLTSVSSQTPSDAAGYGAESANGWAPDGAAGAGPPIDPADVPWPTQPGDASTPDTGATNPYGAVPDQNAGQLPGADGAQPYAPDDATSPPAPGGAPPPAESAPSGPSLDFPSLMQSAESLHRSGRSVEALRQLTEAAQNPAFPVQPAEMQTLTQAMDALAGEVIYSRQHVLEPAYVTQAGDTLQQIAAQYTIPWELLAKINGFVDETTWNPTDPGPLPAGEELKVVRGPFAAVMDVTHNELTLYLNELYAGRFPLQAAGPAVPEQDLTVQDKNPRPVHYPQAAGVVASADDNPLGSRWIGLGGDLGLHGGSTPSLPSSASVRLAEDHLQEVYDILSVGSLISIRR